MFLFSLRRNNSRRIIQSIHCSFREDLPNFIRCFDIIEKQISDVFIKHMTTIPMKFKCSFIGMFDLNNEMSFLHCKKKT